MLTVRFYTRARSGLFKDLILDEKVQMLVADVIYIDDRLVKYHPDLVVCPCCHYCGESMDPEVLGSICGVCSFLSTKYQESNPATRESEGWTTAFAKLL